MQKRTDRFLFLQKWLTSLQILTDKNNEENVTEIRLTDFYIVIYMLR
jgi:hypothetical protein